MSKHSAIAIFCCEESMKEILEEEKWGVKIHALLCNKKIAVVLTDLPKEIMRFLDEKKCLCPLLHPKYTGTFSHYGYIFPESALKNAAAIIGIFGEKGALPENHPANCTCDTFKGTFDIIYKELN